MAAILDRYILDPTHIGGGGMGEVWGATDEKLGRRVAIKFVKFPNGVRDQELEARFDHEAKIMARLRHPGTPAVHDIGVYDDPVHGRRQFMVMEFIDGVGLDDIVAEHGSLSIGWVASVGAQVAAVLEAAHGKEILHRDLKPSNLMLCRDGSVQVVDFGLAVMHDPELTKLTRTGQILGTESYMSPEQVEQNELTVRSDLYSLGCVLHELLTGRTLFTGPTSFSIMKQQVGSPAAPVGRLRPDVPRELDEVVMSMLAKRPNDRPTSAREVHDRLMPYLSGTGPLLDVTSPEPSPVRMYAHAVSRTITSGAPAVVQVGPLEQSDFSRSDIGRARRRADSLVRDSQYDAAADVLAEVLAPASRVLAPGDSEVLDLRGHLANVLFEGGDYLAAAQAFQQLAKQLGDDDERAFQSRMQEAICHLQLGDTQLCLQIMGDLLADELRVYPEDDPRTLELRRQIGELEQSAGDAEAARITLTSLLDDLTRIYGPEHPASVRVLELLAAL
ncbi:serine/threonine-protein kinase [Microtetraspora glauca]|uniref:Serine/threonine-protein kinase n=1 Tax=Microtetraspora glauca TaxID=1996 RepID=A0ABV3GTN1_MICGL